MSGKPGHTLGAPTDLPIIRGESPFLLTDFDFILTLWHRLAAEELGGVKTGAYFVPHGAYAAQVMKSLGASVVNANYPNDHTHTSPYLANIMAGAFVHGLTCGTSELGRDIVNSTASLASYGACIAYNATVPL